MPSQTFTTPGDNTWTAPAGVTSVTSEEWGGGQGGDNSGGGGGGGAGGDYAKTNSITVVPGNNYTAHVGLGGAGGHGAAGGNGGDSWFLSTSTAQARGGGSAGANVGDVTHAGGGGGSPEHDTHAAGGGGGGGAGSTADGSNGGSASGGAGGSPGAGGATGGGSGGTGDSSVPGPIAPSAGSAPGGGGGGAGATSGSAGGGSGQVVLTWTVTAQPPPTRQASQRVDPLPNFWVEYPPYRQTPFAQWFVPDKPPTRQASQRIDPLPNFWVEYPPYQETPFSQWFVPGPPPTRQASQRVDQPKDLNFAWWEQLRQQPIPVSFIPTPPTAPPTRQASQRIDPLPSYTYIWWEQFQTRRLIPPSSNFRVSQEGTSGVYMVASGVSQQGTSRVKNNIEGWNVYVGIDALPDRTQPPAAFTLTLPLSLALTPPASGVRTYYFLVVKQDAYGLESQNQKSFSITIDSSGNQVLPALNPPQALKLFPLAGGFVRVSASYPGLGKDLYPATSWKVWFGSTPPNPSVDTPTVVVAITGQVLVVNVGPNVPGTYYAAVGLFRAADSALSPVLTGSVVLPVSPAEVVAVPSGYDVEP